VWVVALAIDSLGPVVIGIGRGWGIAAEHFAERFGLIILIALGESIIAIGFGAGSDLDAGVLLSVMLGVIVVSALVALFRRGGDLRAQAAPGGERCGASAARTRLVTDRTEVLRRRDPDHAGWSNAVLAARRRRYVAAVSATLRPLDSPSDRGGIR
jgi:hypothetical protein